jgi:hypothetical protein
MDEKLTKDKVEQMIKERISKVIGQFNIFPDQIKSRHIGEGIRFIRSGLAASRPTSGEKAGAVWFSTDSDTLNIWNGTAWVQEILT